MIPRLGLALCVVGTVTAGCSAGAGSGDAQRPASSSASASASASTTIKVASSLDGLKVLPTRLAWTVAPKVSGGSASGSAVAKVEFMIDGAAAWVEHSAPYAYGSEGNLLVTTFLKPGTHTFTSHVATADGTTAEDTVTAAVQPSPPVPSVLLGVTWARQVSSMDLPGRWTITAKPFGWFFGDPQGGGANQDVSYPSPGKVIVRAYIDEPPAGKDLYGGGFCEPPDPTTTYAYRITADGKTLTFTAISKDGCAGRNNLLQGGTWSRVSG